MMKASMHTGVRVPSSAALALLALLAAGCPGKDKPKGPPAPTSVTAAAGDGFVVVDWTPVAKAARYIVYMAQEPGITKENYDQLDGANRFDYDGLQPPFQADFLDNGTTYFFIVTSVSSDNYEGPESSEVSASPSPWGPPGLVESLPGEAIGLTADVDGAGNVHAVWARGEGASRQAIHAARWDAGTSAWGATVSLDSAFGISGTPSLAIHPAGDGFASWRQGVVPDDRIWGAWFDAVNGWDPPFLLTDSGAGASRNPAVAYADDDVFVAWTQAYVSGTSGTLTGIFTRVAANGAGFGPTEQLDPGGSGTDYPRVVAAAGEGLAAWVQAGQVRTDEWNGAWAGSAAFSTTADEPVFVRLATNAAGDHALTWVEQNLSTDLYVARYDSVGGAWMEPVLLEQSALDVTDPRIAVCPGGEVVVVFLQAAGLHFRLMGARWTPADGWSQPEIVHESIDGDAEAPYLAVDADCTARVVWIQEVVGLGGPGTTRNIYSSRLFIDESPDAWGPPLLVSGYGLNSSPVLTIDATGAVMALWELYGAAGEEIWFNVLGD